MSKVKRQAKGRIIRKGFARGGAPVGTRLDGRDTRASVVLPPPPERLLALVDQWATDDSGYEDSTWPQLRKALEQDRLSNRPLFAE